MPLNASQQPQNTYGSTVSQTQPFVFPTISPSLNGEVLGVIEGNDRPRLAIRAAIDEARAAAETALANTRAIHGNPEWPDGRKHVESNVAATRVVEPMLATLGLRMCARLLHRQHRQRTLLARSWPVKFEPN
jgi:hypothetical protein